MYNFDNSNVTQISLNTLCMTHQGTTLFTKLEVLLTSNQMSLYIQYIVTYYLFKCELKCHIDKHVIWCLDIDL